MYVSLAGQWIVTARKKIWHVAHLHSGLLVVLVIVCILLGLAFGWKEHKRGRFSQLKAELKKAPAPPAAPAMRPGGQEAIILERAPIEGATTPEFLKATLLPGRGMSLLQITASLPQKGEIQLLASPTLEKAANQLSGAGADATGAASLTMGGAFEAPWSGRLTGSPASDGKSMNTTWEGRVISLPANWHNSVLATSLGGLLLKLPSTTAGTNAMPDGGEAEADFDASDFDRHWPSRTEITTRVQLNSRAIEMRLVARNRGEQPEPMGLGWQGLFAILSKDRDSVRLRVPSDVRIEVNRSGLPTGRLISAPDSNYDLSARLGAPLGKNSIDETFVHLRQALLENGPILELRDTENNYGLRFTILSSAIKAVHVDAPAGKNFISIAPRFNYDDPFGHEWPSAEDTGMVTLQPGQSVEWRVRIEIFSLTESPHI